MRLRGGLVDVHRLFTDGQMLKATAVIVAAAAVDMVAALLSCGMTSHTVTAAAASTK